MFKYFHICPNLLEDVLGLPDVPENAEISLICKIKRFQIKQKELEWFLHFPHISRQSNYSIPWSAISPEGTDGSL